MISLLAVLGAAALHSIWQSALIATAAWLLLAGSRSALAHYRIAMSALLMIATLFLATALLSFRSAVQPVSVPLPAFNPIVQRTLFTLPQLLQWLGFAWVMGLIITLSWYAGGWLVAHRTYVRGALPARRSWQTRVADVARRRGMHAPRVLSSEVVDSPAVFGLSDPVLVLPTNGMAGLDDAQIEGIIAHELTHIERRDGIVNALQCILDALLFFNPMARWLSRTARAQREHICDASAVEACGSPRSYVDALLTLEETRCYGAQFVLPASGGLLVERVRRLVRPQSPLALPRTPLNALALGLVLAACASTATLPPAMQSIARQIAGIIRYTVDASDPAGAFTVSVEKGIAVRATLDGTAVSSHQIVQRGDSVFILNPRGARELALHVRPNGGITWSPRSRRPII